MRFPGAADPSRSAKSRLSGVERGPLPDSIASVVQAFRQLCVLMWVLHARDKTSLFSRKYRRLHSQDAETTEVSLLGISLGVLAQLREYLV